MFLVIWTLNTAGNAPKRTVQVTRIRAISGESYDHFSHHIPLQFIKSLKLYVSVGCGL